MIRAARSPLRGRRRESRRCLAPLCGARLEPGVVSHPDLLLTNKKGSLPTALFVCMAEKVGFEPTEALASTVFKTAAFDHSATSPGNLCFTACIRLRCAPEAHGSPAA